MPIECLWLEDALEASAVLLNETRSRIESVESWAPVGGPMLLVDCFTVPRGSELSC